MDEVTWAQQGFVPFRGKHVWYGIAGEREEPGVAPLLVVHGGPGLPHDVLEPLAALATGRRVIFYDQFGCGNSDRPDDPSCFSIALFVEELATIRRELGLDRLHLLGHSYGGALCLQYVLERRPTGIASLILSNTFASVPALVAGWHELRAKMPAAALATLVRHEREGTTDSDAYNATLWAHFIAKHVVKSAPTAGMMRAQQKMNHDVYRMLHGPTWFEATGEYGDWDVTGRLAEITIPTLVIVGEDDQCVPALSQAIHRGIPGSQLAVIEECAHLPFIDRPERYLRLIDGFLRQIEQQSISH